jgi:hypothetical protein
MALSKKELKQLKQKMKDSNPSALNTIRQNSSKRKMEVKKTVFKDEDFKRVKSVVRWNFKTNQLVKIKHFSDTDLVGLIVSDFEYFNSKVEKNCFFVLINNSVKQIDGRYLREV